ncbi:MAG: DUF429 domain-containing protein [Chromatiaceae bacterium]|nr:DUF429 domain-containing protein [Chromatiaceae bacterium]
MFFEGAPQLLRAGITIPRVHDGDPERICVEAYPGLLARALIGRRPYKQDDPRKQSPEREQPRRELLTMILDGRTRSAYGLEIQAPLSLADDPGGDTLDALLCAIQTAWAWTQQAHDDGQPTAPGSPRPIPMPVSDPLEGWIADPHLLNG